MRTSYHLQRVHGAISNPDIFIFTNYDAIKNQK